MAKYDYTDLAREIVSAVGGSKNISSVQNCMTRLRFVLKDESRADDEKVKKIKGVQGLMKQGGQYQVVIGTNVKDVIGFVRKEAGISDTGAPAQEEEAKGSVMQRFFKAITGCIMPLIPGMCAAGVIKGLLTVLVTAGALSTKSGTYIVLYAASDAILYFLPIMVGFNAGKVFGATPIITACIGGALMYPTILTAVTKQTHLTFLGIPLQLINYSQTILPILLAAWLASKIQKLAEKIIPRMLQLILVPAIVLMVTVPVSFIVIGPVMTIVSKAMSAAVLFLFNHVPVIGGIIFGGFWQLFVLLGIHTAFIPVLMNNLFTLGYDPINGVMGISVWAIAGVALGYAIKVKDREKKSMAIGNWITGLCGVTEPTIYSLALPNFKLFICAMIGGGIGGAIGSAMGIKMYNYVGDGLFRIPAMINPKGIDISFYGFILCAVLAMVISAVLAFIVTDAATGTAGMAAPKNLGRKDKREAASMAEKEQKNSPDTLNINALVNGKVVPIEEVKDETFAGKILGDGIAIDPSEGIIKAPASCEVVQMSDDMKHAIGLSLPGGLEMLIHVGIDTVKLNGDGFTQLAKTGDHVKCGQDILKFDLKKICDAGYDATVMVVVTDMGDYTKLEKNTAQQEISTDDWILRASKE